MNSKQFFFLFLPLFFFLSLIESFMVNLFSYRLFDVYISFFLSMLVLFKPTFFLILSYFMISLIKGFNDFLHYYFWFFIFITFQALWFFYKNYFKIEKFPMILIFWGISCLFLFLIKILYFYNLINQPKIDLLFKVFYKGLLYFGLTYFFAYVFYLLQKKVLLKDELENKV
jgi:hypothetical protein